MRWSPGCNCCEDPAVLTNCCQSLGEGGFAYVPASSVLSEDCEPFAFPYFGNLIVEVNGQIRPVPCDGNGSYSVPNNDNCAVGGVNPGVACAWTGRFGPGCLSGGFTRMPYLNIYFQSGLYRAGYGFVRSDVACNTSDIFFRGVYARFELTGTVADFSGPVDLPCTFAQSDFGGPYWDVAVPLTVYF